MSAYLRPDLKALQGGLEEADLLARLADAVLDYVTDGYQATHAVGVHHGRVANLERVPTGPCMPQGIGRE